MLIVGLTGSFKTGKSTVAKMFRQRRVPVIDSDRIVHSILKSNKACIREITKVFGCCVQSHQGINRRELGRIVFNDLIKLRKLEKIVHPKVRKEVLKKLNEYKRKRNVKVVVVDIPLLFESGFHKITDVSVVVSSLKSQQIQRAGRQLKLSKTEAERRISMQMPLTKKIRWADFVIDNKGSLNSTKKQVEKLWQKLLQREKKLR